MRCEWPVLRRCCLCIPLRFGLLGLGYAKVTLDLAFMLLLVESLKILMMHSTGTIITVVINSISITLLIVDVVLNIFFICGSHKKDPAKLRVFYRYSLVMLVLSILWALAFIIFNIVMLCLSFFWIFMIYRFIIYITTWTLGIILQVYTIILVINEVKKLESNRQFQFTNDMNGAWAMAEDQPSTTVELE